MGKKNCVLLKSNGNSYQLFSKDIKRVHVRIYKKTPKLPKFEILTEDETQGSVWLKGKLSTDTTHMH